MEETKKLIYEGVDVVIFEDGWWMKQEDRRRLWIDHNGKRRPFADPAWLIGRDETTRQLTIVLMPPPLTKNTV